MSYEIQVSNASNNTHTIFKHTNWWTHYFVQSNLVCLVYLIFCVVYDWVLKLECHTKLRCSTHQILYTLYLNTRISGHTILFKSNLVCLLYLIPCAVYDWVLKLECHTKLRCSTHQIINTLYLNTRICGHTILFKSNLVCLVYLIPCAVIMTEFLN